jgi:hypothetical protein
VHIVLKYLADFIFQRLDEAQSNPGLHAVAGEVCAILVYPINSAIFHT